MGLPTIFELIQKNPTTHRINYTNDGSIVPIISINKDAGGYYINTVDLKNKPCIYQIDEVKGEFKAFISRYNVEQTQQWSIIDWNDEGDHIYINENEYLIRLLPKGAVILDSNNKELLLDLESEVIAKFYIAKLEENYKVSLTAFDGDVIYSDVKAISEQMIIADNRIISSQYPLLNPHYIESLTTEATATELPIILSLIASYVSSDIMMDNYKIVTLASTISAQKTIIFDSVDEDNNLYLRIIQTLTNLDNADALEKYKLTSLVTINEEQSIILLQPIKRSSDDTIYQEFYDKLISNLGRKNKNRIGFDPPMVILDKELAFSFLTDVLPDILNDYELLGQEKLKEYKIIATRPKLNANLNSGLDFLEGEVTLDFDGEEMDVFAAINMWKKNKYIKLKDGQNVLIAKDYIKRLERLFTKKGDKVRISFFDLPIAEDLLENQLNSSVFKKHRAVFEGFNKIKSIRNSKKINAELRDYQKYGISWMQYLQTNNVNGCLADDMGLGKTLQALSLLALNKDKKPTIVIMPRTLLYNWSSEIEKFVPGLTSCIYYGGDRDFESAKKNEIILTTYGVVRNDIQNIKETEYHYIILDESQNIKNFNSKTTKAVMMLKGDHKLALSGTPLENNLGELYSLFRFLNPAMLGSEGKFQEQYLLPIQKYGDEEATLQLRKKIYPFILRRLKKDVLKELPEKIDNVIFVDQSPQQKKIYEQRRQFYKIAIDQMVGSGGIEKAQFFIFQAFSELRQLASVPEAKTDGKVKSPKLELLAEHMVQSILNGHKVLVFANFLAAIELINEVLEEHDIHYVSMKGATSNRKKLINEFKQNEDCKAFVMTLKTGGTGLNLTEADIIYIFDPWWNGAAETQAIDRAHRMGQDKTVISYRLICKDSIEEKILELQNQKKELFDSLISSDSSMTKSLSKQDIDFILK